MNKRTAGVAFCFIAAILYLGRYVVAAIFGSGVSSWSANIFNTMLTYVGSDLSFASIISLIVGIVYLAWAELENTKAFKEFEKRLKEEQ